MTSAERSGQVLAVSTAFLALFSIVGFALYGLPFFYDFYVNDLGWTRQQVTSGNAYSKVLVAVTFGFLAGLIVDRFGPRRIMIAGILMAGGALVGLAHVHTLTAFHVFYVFNALGYVFGGPLPNQVLLSRWFQPAREKAAVGFLVIGVAIAMAPVAATWLVHLLGLTGMAGTQVRIALTLLAWIPLLYALVQRLDDKRGKAMGLAYLGIGMGGTLVPFLANALVERYTWRPALQILGLLMIAVALPVAWFVREPPADPKGQGGTAGPSGGIGAVLRQPAFYLLAVGSMASIGAVGGTIQNMKLYLTGDRGLPQAETALVLSLILAGSLVGRVLMGWLADRWPKKHVMLLVYVIVAAAIPLMVFAPSTAMLRVFAFLFGIGLGGDYMIIPLMAAELFGVKILGRVMGIVLTADSVAEALMPMRVAHIRDVSGSYGIGFLQLSALAAVGAIAVALLPRRGTDAAPAPRA